MTSDLFNLSNGVRQNEVLYVDNLSSTLISAAVGCHVHN